MLGFLFNIVKQRNFKAASIQVLQSLNILIENTKNDNALCEYSGFTVMLTKI